MAEPMSAFAFSTWRKIAMATWRPRKDPMIWATAEIEASRLFTESPTTMRLGTNAS
jgi:hypothetical protein